MKMFFRHRPGILVVLGGLLLILAVAFHVSSSRTPNQGAVWIVVSLGIVVFLAFALGIILFWWHSLKPMESGMADLGMSQTMEFDITELFLKPEGLVHWFEKNLTRLRETYSNFERVSQLIGLINYSVDLTRQTKLALCLAHEIFQEAVISIFLWQNGSFVFSTSTRLGPTGIIEEISEGEAKTLGFHDTLHTQIDTEKLRQLSGVCFALPCQKHASATHLEIMPLIIWNRVLGVIMYLLPEKRPFDPDEKMLASMLNRNIAVFIENHYLYQENLQKERLRKEIEIAKQIQDETLPKTFQTIHGFDIMGKCLPCNEISGDYYDFISLPNDGLLVTIADVSGKGVPAALFLSKIQTLVRAMASRIESPAELLTFLSRHMAAEQLGSLFATMFIGIIRTNSPFMTCSNAGHCKPLVVRSRAGFVEEISFDIGIPLGLFEPTGEEYVDQSIELLPGDGILLYSDGLTDSVNGKRTRYGVEKIKSILERNPELEANGTIKAIFDDVHRFREQAPLEDDITVVYVKSELVKP